MGFSGMGTMLRVTTAVDETPDMAGTSLAGAWELMIDPDVGALAIEPDPAGLPCPTDAGLFAAFVATGGPTMVEPERLLLPGPAGLFEPFDTGLDKA